MESFNTLGYSIRLVGTPKVQSDDMAEVVRQLYLIRQNLNAAIPGAGLMEAPDLDEATAYLIHPGVRAYVNGEQRNFFDRYSDYIYLLMFVGSGLGSVVAGAFGMMGARRDAPTMPIGRVEAMFDAVRDAKSRDEARCDGTRGRCTVPLGVSRRRGRASCPRPASRASRWR